MPSIKPERRSRHLTTRWIRRHGRPATRPRPLSTTVVWAHRTLLNTGTFVGTVGPVFKDPAVASAVAARATDELFTELNLQTRLRDALPPKASFAAVPITNATKGYVAGELTKVPTSPSSRPSGPRH